MKRKRCLLIGFTLLIVLAVGCNAAPPTTPIMSPSTNNMATPDWEINPTMPTTSVPSPTMTNGAAEDMVPSLPDT